MKTQSNKQSRRLPTPDATQPPPSQSTQGAGYKISGKLGGQALTIQVEPPIRSWADPSLYAPAIPGVLVALLGLWVSHVLAAKRDRRKEILDLCSEVKELADEAAKLAIEAWVSEPSAERKMAVHEAKSKIQALGVAATTLEKRSAVGKLSWRKIFNRTTSVDVLKKVALLRRAATKDPFETPDRASSDTQVGAINTRRASILSGVDDAFSDIYG